MCLYSKTNIPKIAKKDIKVYKILHSYKGKFLTPYRGYRMEEGYHYMQTGKKFGIKRNRYYGFFIGMGLHAFTTLKEAQMKYSYLFEYAIIVEMIVPKGSEYFINPTDKEICSDNLIWYEGAKQYKEY